MAGSNRLRMVGPATLALFAAMMLALAPAIANGQAAEGDVMVSEHAELGSILVTAEGMTLYTTDTECTDECLETWPPFMVESEDALPTDLGVELGVTADMQVTVDGQSVYTYTGDTAAGDATGTEIEGWSVIQIETEGEPTPTPEPDGTPGPEGEGEFSIDPTSGGLTLTAFTGSIAQLGTSAETHSLVSVFATVEGEFVGYIFGAPDFVNAEFMSQFEGGLDAQNLVVLAGE